MFLNPQQVIENLQLMPGMKVADFGVGSGDFALSASRMVGKNGIIYAIDIKKEALESVKNRAKLSGIYNVQTIRADLENHFSTTLANETIDYAIIANLLFQIAGKENIVREAFRILKLEGKIILIDWLPEAGKFGPIKRSRLSKEDAKKLFEIRGFNFEREFYAGDYHFGMIFSKI